MAAHIHYHRRAEDDPPDKLPTGLTEEQLDFFTEQTERAVRKATRRDRRTAVTGFVILAVGLVLALADSSRSGAAAREATIQSGRAVAVEGCNRDFLDRLNFRGLLERLEEASRTSKTATPQQKAMAQAFYATQLKKFTLPDCRQSEKLLTSDPDARVPVIAPYYPGAPYVPDSNG